MLKSLTNVYEISLLLGHSTEKEAVQFYKQFEKDILSGLVIETIQTSPIEEVVLSYEIKEKNLTEGSYKRHSDGFLCAVKVKMDKDNIKNIDEHLLASNEVLRHLIEVTTVEDKRLGQKAVELNLVSDSKKENDSEMSGEVETIQKDTNLH